MEMTNVVLGILVPVFEYGITNRLGFSRERVELYTTQDKELLQSRKYDLFSFNKKGYAYITMQNARIIRQNFVRAEPDIIGTITDKRGNVHKDYSFSIERFADNSGVNGEFTLECYFNGITRASKELDKKGIDFFIKNLPLQLKTCFYGKSELNHYENTLVKKSGISVINMTVDSYDKLINM